MKGQDQGRGRGGLTRASSHIHAWIFMWDAAEGARHRDCASHMSSGEGQDATPWGSPAMGISQHFHEAQEPSRTLCDGRSPAQKGGQCSWSSLIQHSFFFPLNQNSAGRKQFLSHPFSSGIKERKSNTNQHGSEDVNLECSSLDQGRGSRRSRSNRAASKRCHPSQGESLFLGI